MASAQVINPATGTGTVPGSTTPTGTVATTNSAAPVPAVPTVANPLAVTQANPFAAPQATTSTAPAAAGTVPATSPIATTGDPTTVQTNGINWNDGSKTVTGDLKDTYGAGTGTAISDLLQQMGTTDSSAIQATIANTDLAAGKQYSNIQSSEAASGVTANSSTAGLAAGDFYTGVNAQLQQTIGSEEEQEQSELLNTLTNEGSAHGTDPSTLDSIMNGITDAGQIGGAILGL
jgi:hypothetical protein